ncbi:MAG TPA: TolC family protein, partial [Haliangium sp.]|nr:TolC family protein [Haliangium sp.]
MLWLAPGTAAAQAPAAPAQTPATPAAPQTQPSATPAPASAQPGQAPGQVQALTLADAERLALRESPELQISQKSVDAASRRVQAARSQRLPRLSVESNLLVWNKPIEIPFTMPPAVIRGQVTSTTTVTVAQPLTPLIAIGKLIEVEEAGRSASEAEVQGTRVDVAFRATDGYLIVLLAQAGQQVATQRVAQV